MSIQGDEDVVGLKRIGNVVARVRDALGAQAVPGVTTLDLDQMAGQMLREAGATSAPILAYGFPGHSCISVNDEIAHGVPSASRVLKSGDLVNIDVSAELDGYWADTGASFIVGRASPLHRELISKTRKALKLGLKAAKAGAPINRIGRAIENFVRSTRFTLVENLCGHGVGRHIHEEPSIPNYYDHHSRTKLTEGLVITIEPFLTTGADMAVEDQDGWTLRTPDGSVGAQFEHTLIVTRTGPVIVTA